MYKTQITFSLTKTNSSVPKGDKKGKGELA